MTVLGTADDYYQLIDSVENMFHGLQMTEVKGLKTAHIEARAQFLFSEVPKSLWDYPCAHEAHSFAFKQLSLHGRSFAR